MRALPTVVALCAGVLLVSCERTSPPPLEPTDPAFNASSAAGIPMNATVQFGAEPGKHGTDFPPGSHDWSFRSVDRAFPTAVNIRRGGSVTFVIGPVHQVGVYAPGTRPQDIDVSQTEPIPVLPILDRIIDTTNRVALGPGQAFGIGPWTTPPGTFDQPGRYLVICTTLVHFVFANMYAWVNVH